MTKHVYVEAAMNEASCVFDILDANEELNYAMGDNVRALVSKLVIDLMEGEMNQFQYTKALQATNELLLASLNSDLERLERARIELQYNTKFSRDAFQDEKDTAQIVTLVCVCAVFFALLIANIAIPFIALPITILGIFPVIYLTGLLGEEIGAAVTKSNVNSLSSKATFFANRNTVVVAEPEEQELQEQPATSI